MRKTKSNKTFIVVSILILIFSCLIDVQATSNVDAPIREQANVKETIEFVDTNPNTMLSNQQDITAQIVEQLSNRYAEKQDALKTIDFIDNCEFKYSFCSGNSMTYYLFHHSEIEEYDNVPLIIWLHGSGERSVNEKTYLQRGWIPLLFDWDFDMPNAYILCPQITNTSDYSRWNCQSAAQDISLLISNFSETHSIDLNRIYILGHSLGGQGSLYLATELEEVFAACVTLSPYNPGVDYTQTLVPISSYVGTTAKGEDGNSVSFANQLTKFIGVDNTHIIQTNHGQLPYLAFSIDSDSNNRPDLFEWLFLFEKYSQN